MPIATGVNHIAVLTPNLEKLFSFYEAVFDAEVTFTMEADGDHPRMWIFHLGGGFHFNAFEVTDDTIVGDRRKLGGRGPIDHFGIEVESRAVMEDIKERLVANGADIGDIQELGTDLSLFFRDPDGFELEVVATVDKT